MNDLIDWGKALWAKIESVWEEMDLDIASRKGRP